MALALEARRPNVAALPPTSSPGREDGERRPLAAERYETRADVQPIDFTPHLWQPPAPRS
jgi:hypothetical protein